MLLLDFFAVLLKKVALTKLEMLLIKNNNNWGEPKWAPTLINHPLQENHVLLLCIMYNMYNIYVRNTSTSTKSWHEGGEIVLGFDIGM